MAKKKQLKEDAKYKNFQLPEFDVRGFIVHELEQTYATTFALIFALVFGLLSWRITLLGLADTAVGVLPFSLGCLALGIAGAVVMVFVVRHLRHPKSQEYRKGDWASLIAVYCFLWLGTWALFLNL